jgi:hypothetical protein
VGLGIKILTLRKDADPGIAEVADARKRVEDLKRRENDRR